MAGPCGGNTEFLELHSIKRQHVAISMARPNPDRSAVQTVRPTEPMPGPGICASNRRHMPVGGRVGRLWRASETIGVVGNRRVAGMPVSGANSIPPETSLQFTVLNFEVRYHDFAVQVSAIPYSREHATGNTSRGIELAAGSGPHSHANQIESFGFSLC